MAEAEVPPAPTMSLSAARNEFSEKLEEVRELVTQDKVPEELYKQLCNSAKNFHEAKRIGIESDAREQPGSALLTQVRDRVSAMIGDMHAEIEDYKEQLTAATVTIDALQDVHDYKTKCIAALKRVLNRHKISDEELLAEYDTLGIRERVERERERRKRPREEPPQAPTAVVEIETDDD